MISCIPKSPEDKIDHNTTLRTADEKPMRTYGTKKITVQLGRKAYSVEAMITDITQRIVGMEFFQ